MLTDNQRLHFDANGFVVVPGVLTETEAARTRDVLDRLSADPDPAAKNSAVGRSEDGAMVRFGPLVEYDPWLLEVASHATTMAIIRQLIGQDVRLEETEAIINRRPAGAEAELVGGRRFVPLGLHRGIAPEMNCYLRGGNVHYHWVKALTMLTDLGPDDGGTLMIRGSHCLPSDPQYLTDNHDDGLFAQAEGLAGSVLFMAESCVHSTALPRSDRVRYTLINGYTPAWAQAWPGHDTSSDFVAGQTPEMAAFLTGSTRWWGAR